MLQFIEIGDKINLWKIEKIKTKEKLPKRYVSQVLDFFENSSDKLKIAMPIDNGRVIPLEVGDKYLLCFFTKNGLYQCRAIIKERYKEDNLYILEIQIVSDFEKYQRRQFYRLECVMDFDYRIITKEEQEYESKIRENNFDTEDEKEETYCMLEELQKKWQTATMSDLSGGGARFNSIEMHEKNDIIAVKIPLLTINENGNNVLKGNVISVVKIDNRPGFYEYRIEFFGLGEVEREAVIKFIFEEERRKRRREKEMS